MTRIARLPVGCLFVADRSLLRVEHTPGYAVDVKTLWAPPQADDYERVAWSYRQFYHHATVEAVGSMEAPFFSEEG